MRTTLSINLRAGRVSGGRSGFTLVELMTVITIILIVVGMLSVALNQTKARTLRVACLDNMKQLQLAWMLYSDDHNDLIALNQTDPLPAVIGLAGVSRSSTNSWVAGNPKEDRTPENLMKGSLYYNVKNPQVYRCPMDGSMTKYGNYRTRSYSVNAYLGGDDPGIDPRVKMKVSEIINPPPEKVFVFIEEHEQSAWGSGFLVLPREQFTSTGGAWSSTPSDRHMQGCNLTFADGHLEYWKWSAPKRPNPNPNSLITNTKDLRDLRRLQECVPKP